jgi:hypothetical protein
LAAWCISSSSSSRSRSSSSWGISGRGARTRPYIARARAPLGGVYRKATKL